MKRITKILLCVLCAVAAVLCVAAACFMLLKKQSGTTASSAASGASVSIYGKVSIWVWISASVGSMSALESGSADTSSGKVT